ncbi:IS5 family transposase [Plasticicumulans acidivorans]|uniref:IS4 family transposase n=1 Tax=Plasticicumulans acidivorans TaxID=886464 RepID=A0A317MXZ5_9GAMM|nr:IS5 family transposase [Plasticicumulans acidivorans]PWV63408.1 IS4 family transposase [Plasticicumulans acidivorans]
MRNWSEYEAALVQRGSLTLWIDEAMLAGWHESQRTGRRGASCIYSETAIQCALTVRVLYRLPLRAAEGLLRLILQLMGADLAVPDHTTLSRRGRTLNVAIERRASEAPRHLLIDSTRLKVFGEGEWKVRKHGADDRCVWRKLHLAVDAATHEVVAALVTESSVGDAEVLPELLAQVLADGAHDTRACHDLLLERKASAAIPPCANAAAWAALPDGRVHPRSAALEVIERDGLKAWKQPIGYHRRSLAETAMGRIKGLFGDHLQARSWDGQVNECYLRVAAMNRMTRLGMPLSQARHR